jgi:Tol biopolymer transport system component
MALAFDEATGQTRGKPVPVASAASHSFSSWRAAFSASSSIVAYHTGDLVEGEGAEITWYDRDGKQLQTIDQVTTKASLRQSRDGAWLAYSARQDVWVFDRARQMPTRVTFLPGFEGQPIWSPDGSELAFYYTLRTSGDTPMGLYRLAVGGGTPQLVLAKQGLEVTPEDWSPDGKYLLFSRTDRGGNGDLLALPLDPVGEPLTIAATPFNEAGGRFSPDGHWIAYHSAESGEDEIYVVSFDPSPGSAGPQRKLRISNAGGQSPVWSRDGSELYYLANRDMLMAVDIDAVGPRFRPGTPKALFPINLGHGNIYDVGPDGSFVVTLPDDQSSRPIELILNWTSALP